MVNSINTFNQDGQANHPTQVDQWADLPTDVCYLIFSRLSKEQKIQSTLVCKRWKQILHLRTIVDVRTFPEFKSLSLNNHIPCHARWLYKCFRDTVQAIGGCEKYHSLPEFDMRDLRSFQKRVTSIFFETNFLELLDVSDLVFPIVKVKNPNDIPCIVYKYYTSMNPSEVNLGFIIFNISGIYRNLSNEIISELFSRPALTFKQFQDPKTQLTKHFCFNEKKDESLALCADNVAAPDWEKELLAEGGENDEG